MHAFVQGASRCDARGLLARRRRRAIFTIVFVFWCAPHPFTNADEETARVVHQANGLFGPIFVTDEDGLRSMRFGSADADEQSVVDLRAPRAIPLAYLRTAALGLALVDARLDDAHVRARGARVLIVGLGGGAFLAATAAYPTWRVDAVEIDPAVVTVARTHFALDAHSVARVVIDDGRDHLLKGARASRAPYDFILVDAYAGDDYPAHLADDAFFTLVFDRLSPAGVLVLNIALDRIAARALVARVATAFPEGCTVAAIDDDENLVVVATRAPHAPEDIRRAAREADARARHPFSLVTEAEPAIACVDRLRGRQ